MFLARASGELPCRLQRVEAEGIEADAVLTARAMGPSSVVTARARASNSGTYKICFCPVETGIHALDVHVEYQSRRSALHDPPDPEVGVTNSVGLPRLIGKPIQNSPFHVQVDDQADDAVPGSSDCGSAQQDGGWWLPAVPHCTPPPGLAIRRRFSAEALQRCLTNNVRLAMLGDSVSERFCIYLTRTYSPGCCADCGTGAQPPQCRKGRAACIRLRGNGLYNDVAGYVGALRNATLQRPRPSVLVVNVGLWDAAYGRLSAYKPGRALAAVLTAAVSARDSGIQVIWRTTSAVHPDVARSGGKLLDKHAFLNQPRVDEINRLATSQALRAGLKVVDVAAMTRLRPDLLEPGDMRHYDDRMHAEMMQLLAPEICGA